VINIVLLVIIGVLVFLGGRATLRQLGGESICCGKGGKTIAEDKKLDGEPIASKEVLIGGMKCVNCKNHVQNSLNKISGLAAYVNLKNNTAFIKMTRNVSDEEIKNAVLGAGYNVLSIANM